MKELLSRWGAKSPSLFRKLIKLGITLGAVGATLMEPHIAAFVPALSIYAGYMVTAGAVAAVVAKLTVADSNDIKK